VRGASTTAERPYRPFGQAKQGVPPGVKTYVSALLKRLRLHRRAEAAAFIARHQREAANRRAVPDAQ
jgi:hypothetical protein